MSKQGQIGLSKKIHVQDLVTIVYVKIVAAAVSTNQTWDALFEQLPVFHLSSYWLLIGCCDVFGLDLITPNENALYKKVTLLTILS